MRQTKLVVEDSGVVKVVHHAEAHGAAEQVGAGEGQRGAAEALGIDLVHENGKAVVAVERGPGAPRTDLRIVAEPVHERDFSGTATSEPQRSYVGATSAQVIWASPAGCPV